MTFAIAVLRIICPAALMVSANTPAWADTFHFVGLADDGSVTYVDTTTINRMGNIATVWTITLIGDYLRGDRPETAYYLLQQEFNCSTQRVRPSAMSTYGPDGDRVAGDVAGDQEGPIEPGTFEQDLYKVVCLRVKLTKGIKRDSPHVLARDLHGAIRRLEAMEQHEAADEAN